MHLRYTILAFLCPVVTVLAQPSLLKPVTIGDTVPDIHFQTMVNHPSASVRLSDFKGKLVILDFWATWCTSCLHSFPKMDSLQNEFADRLQVLLVNTKNTGDDLAKVEAFFRKWNHKYGKELCLPSVVNDSIADQLFQHQLIPHYVWINGEGKIIAVTSASQVNATNIRSLLESGTASFLMKKDQDTGKPIFSGPDLPVTGLLNYAVLVKGLFDGLPTGSRIRRTGDVITGRCMTNSPLLDIYKMALRGMRPGISERQIILDVKDSFELLSPLYTIDMLVPVENAGELFPKMMELLNNYSGYYGRWVIRKIRCRVLVKTGVGGRLAIEQLRSKGGVFENKLWDEQRPYLRNGTMDMLIAKLNLLPATKMLVVDESGYRGNIDIEFAGGFGDMGKFQEGLRKYGLRLVEGERRVKVFVIAKKRAD